MSFLPSHAVKPTKFIILLNFLFLASFISHAGVEEDWDTHYKPLYAEHFQEDLSYDAWMEKPKGALGYDGVPIAERLTVSMTSWWGRTHPTQLENLYLGPWLAIESIFRQTKTPHRVVLTLSQDEYAHGLDDVPEILKLQMSRGLEIHFDPGNRKALKKLLPALQDPENGSIAVFDDDWIFKPNALQALWETHVEFPNAICTSWARRVKSDGQVIKPYREWPRMRELGLIPFQHILCMGGSGNLYPYDATGETNHGLHPSVGDNIPDVFVTTDDLWWLLKRVEAGTPVAIAKSNWRIRGNKPKELNLGGPLWEDNGGGKNDAVIQGELLKFEAIRSQLLHVPDSRPDEVYQPFKAVIDWDPSQDILGVEHMSEFNWTPYMDASYDAGDQRVPKNMYLAAKDIFFFRKLFDRFIHIGGEKFEIDKFFSAMQVTHFRFLEYGKVFADPRMRINPPKKPNGISMVFATNRPWDVPLIIENFERQVTEDGPHRFQKELVLVPNGGVFDLEALEKQIASYPESVTRHIKIVTTEMDTVNYLAKCMNTGIAAASLDFVTKADGDDLYGKYYLLDLMRQAWCSGADLFGIQGSIHGQEILLSRARGLVGTVSPKGIALNVHVCGGTLTFHKDLLSKVPFHREGPSSDSRFQMALAAQRGVTLALPHPNYVRTREVNEDLHTAKGLERHADEHERIHGGIEVIYPIEHGINLRGCFL